MEFFRRLGYLGCVFDSETAVSATEFGWPDSGQVQPQVQGPVSPTSPMEVSMVPSAPAAPTARADVGAGMGLVSVVLGGIAGFVVGGTWGAGAGALGVGALRNGSRAFSMWRSEGATPEATKSATVSVLGLAAAGWLGYNAMQRNK